MPDISTSPSAFTAGASGVDETITDESPFPFIFTTPDPAEFSIHLIPSETILFPSTLITNVPELPEPTVSFFNTALSIVILPAFPVSTATSAPSPVTV